MTATTTMNEALRAELERTNSLGWVCAWGRVVAGSPAGVTLERDGVESHYCAPFVGVKRDGQLAIVRWG